LYLHQKVKPAQDPEITVKDALKQVGGEFQPAVFETHGAMDYNTKKLINQICQRAKVFRGYSVSYFRKHCYEKLGQAIFRGLFNRSLNKVTQDGYRFVDGEVDKVTCTDDLNVVVSSEDEVGQTQSISSMARCQLMRGRRAWRRRSGWQVACDVDNFFSSMVSENSLRPPGGSGDGPPECSLVVLVGHSNGDPAVEQIPVNSGFGGAVGASQSPALRERTGGN